MKKANLLSWMFITLFFIYSCSKNSSDTGGSTVNCDVVEKSFATNVNPLIQTFCNQASCHNPGSINGPGPLTNYNQVFNARSTIRSVVQSGFMPQNTTLTAAQKNTIICWIDNGAPDN